MPKILFFLVLGVTAIVFTFEVPNVVAIRHVEPGGIGYNRGYTTLSILGTPYAFSSGYLFLDGRAHLFDNATVAGNAGVGARFGNNRSLFGTNVYYDFRYDRSSFNQIGFGLDGRVERLFFFANGYLPVGSKIHTMNRQEVSFSMGYFAAQEKILNSFKRADIEIGYLVIEDPKFYSYVGVGPYFLREECSCSPTTWGGMGTVKINIKKRLTIEGIFSHDTLFQTKAQIQISLNFPFTRDQLPFLSVARQEIIPIKKRNMWEWNY